MKVVRIINVVLQSLVILGGIAGLFYHYSQEDSYGYSDHREDEAMIIFFVTEMILGLYQIIHAFITSIIRLVGKTFGWLLGIYWILILALFLVWSWLLFLCNLNSFEDEVYVFIVSLGWIPIIYYLITSVIDLKKTFNI